MLRNKFMMLSVLIFSSVFCVSAQTASDVSVSNPQFIYDVNRKFNFISANWTSSDRAPFGVEVVQEISAVFRNNSAKTIKRISWEFITYKDAAKTKIQYIYTSRHKTELLPDTEIRLSKTGRFWGNSAFLEAKVFRIEYADGTFWDGTKTKN